MNERTGQSSVLAAIGNAEYNRRAEPPEERENPLDDATDWVPIGEWLDAQREAQMATTGGQAMTTDAATKLAMYETTTDAATNLALYERFAEPPPAALKTIGGGRLKGMTDINPQWRIHALTEAFGPCGTGWKIAVKNLWTVQPEKGDTVAAFASVDIYYRLPDGTWSEPVEGVGGNQLVQVEAGGARVNDECYKMAITDALSCACKMLGIGAAVYEGRWDGSKYREAPGTTARTPAPARTAAPRKEPSPARAEIGPDDVIPADVAERLIALAVAHHVTDQELSEHLGTHYGGRSVEVLTRREAEAVARWVKADGTLPEDGRTAAR